MTASWFSLVFECVVAVLLAVMIYYAVRLNKRLTEMRHQEPELHALIEEFNLAANRADASASTLKAAGIQAESALRAQVAKAQALRDELAFMGDRIGTSSGDAARAEPKSSAGAFGKRPFAAANAERAERPDRPAARSDDPTPRRDAENRDSGDPDQSRAERDLIRAILSNQPAR